MLLKLNTNTPWDATYTDESGRPIYRCEASTALTFGDRHFKLYRTGTRHGQMECVGEVIFNTWSSKKSRIILSSGLPSTEGILARDTFTKSGSRWARYGRAQTFTAPDGRNYTWTFGKKSCSLHSASSDTSLPLIKFKQRSFRLFSKSLPPMVEVTRGFEGILDMVLLTMIYLEKVRRDKDRSQSAAAAATSGS